MGFILIFGLIAVFANYVAVSEKVLICYYGTWATYRWGKGKFDVENVNPDLCTHVVYTFVGIDHQGNVISLDPYLDLENGRDNFNKFNRLKQKNANLKTLLAVGGWNEGSAKYSVMAANAVLRKNFIDSSLNMVLRYGFDGLDLDWEYPGRRDSVHGAADIENFSILVKEIKEEYLKYGLLLTAAVSSVEASSSQSYNIAEISKYLDLIGIMTYDMYGAWDPVTGHNAPLHRGEGDEFADRNSLNTVDVAVEYWLREGCPPEKLVVGLPLYGRTFTLSNPANNGLRAPSSGPGIAGPYTATSGTIGYNEFCDMMQTQTWDVRYDSLAKVPYAVQNRNWVSFDDPNSITEKVNYGLSHNVAGFMVWSIETDDFNAVCSEEDFPLLRAINRAIVRDVGSSSTSTTSTTTARPTTASTAVDKETTIVDTTTNAPTSSSVASTAVDTDATKDTTTEQPVDTTEAVPSTVQSTQATDSPPPETPEIPETPICVKEGFAASPYDCSIFYMCVTGVNGELIPMEFVCPGVLLWDQDNLLCNFPDLVECDV